ncbi:MAG: glycosyltransferase [Chloroflexota bacterium]
MPRLDVLPVRTVVINLITAGVGLGLLANRRRNSPIPLREWPDGRVAPFVEIIIPARDEERNIGPLLDTLVQQCYPDGQWRVTVVDDGSTDNTSDVVAGFARTHSNVRLVAAPPLPHGWTGKNHAMHTGSLLAVPDADYLLFVDADTRHHPLMLASAVQRAQATGSALLSLIVRVVMGGFWERLIVPEIGELYTLLVGTMDSVNREGTISRAAANGQFLLLLPEAYRNVMAWPEIRSDVAEDRAIAAGLKSLGQIVRLEYGQDLVQARVYSSLREMWAGYSKTMFWASGHNAPWAIAVSVALLFYAFAPILTLAGALFKHNGRERQRLLMHALVQLLPMSVLRATVCRQVGVPPLYAGAYPLAVLVGVAILMNSMLQVTSGRGVAWKGRLYR